jgi:hypothetical protein
VVHIHILLFLLIFIFVIFQLFVLVVREEVIRYSG